MPAALLLKCRVPALPYGILPNGEQKAGGRAEREFSPEPDETGTASRSFSSWEEAEEYLGLTFRRIKDMEERQVYLNSVTPALCCLSASATDDWLISGYEVFFLRKPIPLLRCI